MTKLAFISYVQNEVRSFVSSFTCWRVIATSFLVDILYVFFLAALVRSSVSVLGSVASSVQDFASMPASEATLSTLYAFIGKSVGVFVVFLVIVLVAYSISRAFIWSSIVGVKFTKRLVLRMLGLNAVWLAGWLVVWLFLLAGLRPSYAAVATFVVPIVFAVATAILHHVFASDKQLRIGSALARTASMCLGKLHRLLVPLLLSALVFLAWSQVWRVIPAVGSSVFRLFLIGIIIIAPFLAWFRNYLSTVVARFS